MHAWTTQRTTAEVIAEASARRIPVAPIGTGATVPTLEAFSGREAFTANPSGGFTQPAVPYQLHGADTRPFEPVPAAGEHTGQIEARTPQPNRGEPAALPLAGVRVIDFTAWWAGPIASHSLALLGADVVKVESVQRADGMRFASARPPTADQWWEWGMVFHGANTNKRDITLDLRSPEGVAVAERLIADADVVIENFTPRVMDGFGLTWERLSEINPKLIMTRMPAFGLSGAWRNNTGFAQTMEQLTGMANITGYPDEDPQIPRGPCDPLAGMHAVFATLTALEERDRTGQGRLVEVTMVAAALNAAAEQLVEYSALGRQLPPRGQPGTAGRPPRRVPRRRFRALGGRGGGQRPAMEGSLEPARPTRLGRLRHRRQAPGHRRRHRRWTGRVDRPPIRYRRGSATERGWSSGQRGGTSRRDRQPPPASDPLVHRADRPPGMR